MLQPFWYFENSRASDKFILTELVEKAFSQHLYVCFCAICGLRVFLFRSRGIIRTGDNTVSIVCVIIC